MQLAFAPLSRQPICLEGDNMQRTRFFFGISVLFLAAGIVVTAQGNTAPKSTQTTTPPKSNTAKPAAAKPATPKAAPAPAATAKPQSAASSKAATSSKAPVQKPATVASGTKPQAKPGKPDAAASKTAPKAPVAATAKTDKAPATKVAAKPDAKTAKANHVADAKMTKVDKKSDKPSKTATTTSKSGSTTTTQLTPVQQKLKDNTSLAAKVESRLPKGTNLMTAADGFRDLGQFVAAVNVANNLNVSFDELKAKIVTNKMSLGQAIQAVRPLTASPTIEAQRAEYDARGMIAESAQAEASAAPKTHGPVTTPTSSTAPTPTGTSSTVKTKSKTTKTSVQ